MIRVFGDSLKGECSLDECSLDECCLGTHTLCEYAPGECLLGQREKSSRSGRPPESGRSLVRRTGRPRQELPAKRP